MALGVEARTLRLQTLTGLSYDCWALGSSISTLRMRGWAKWSNPQTAGSAHVVPWPQVISWRLQVCHCFVLLFMCFDSETQHLGVNNNWDFLLYCSHTCGMLELVLKCLSKSLVFGGGNWLEEMSHWTLERCIFWSIFKIFDILGHVYSTYAYILCEKLVHMQSTF